jgi:DNA-binding NarL/FixJ family response regulator
LEIESAARAGRLVDALECYDRVVEVVGRAWTPWFEARLRLAATALAAVADLVEAVPTAERPAVSAQADRLFTDGGAVLDRVAVQGVETAAWAELLAAEWRRVRWVAGDDPPSAAELVAAWQAAVEGFERYGDVYLTARARGVLAEILTATGDPDRARVQAERAREVAKHLGAVPLLHRLDRLDRAYRGSQSSGPAQLPSKPEQTLTHREAEVLALVAQGRSNGEIGKRLFISTKTVSVHVSNILAKLGASGRTEAAALARRKGLID